MSVWVKSSLNRTSVGLKLVASRTLRVLGGSGLNRTSVGLKHKEGIDRIAERIAGLNRTSVVLKPRAAMASITDSTMPQSNQRGIETNVSPALRRGRGGGLNRTSVGLKLDGVSQ